MADVTHDPNPAVALAHAEDVLARLLRIMQFCGLSTDDIAALIHRAMPSRGTPFQAKTVTATAAQHIAYADLVLRWRRDPEFLQESGLPGPLPMKGDKGSFERLVLLTAPGEDPESVLNYVMQVGAVIKDITGRVHLMTESLLTCTGRDHRTISPVIILLHINSFLGSVEFNLAERRGIRKGRFERACYATVPANLVPILERFVEARGQEFVDVVDEWLSRQPKGTPEAPKSTVGAGAYVFVQPEID